MIDDLIENENKTSFALVYRQGLQILERLQGEQKTELQAKLDHFLVQKSTPTKHDFYYEFQDLSFLNTRDRMVSFFIRGEETAPAPQQIVPPPPRIPTHNRRLFFFKSY